MKSFIKSGILLSVATFMALAAWGFIGNRMYGAGILVGLPALFLYYIWWNPPDPPTDAPMDEQYTKTPWDDKQP